MKPVIEVRPGFYSRGNLISEHNKSYRELNDVFQLALEFYQRLCFLNDKIMWLQPDMEVDLVNGQYMDVNNPTAIIDLGNTRFYLVKYKVGHKKRYCITTYGLSRSNYARKWTCINMTQNQITLHLSNIFYDYNLVQRNNMKRNRRNTPYSLSKGVY